MIREERPQGNGFTLSNEVVVKLTVQLSATLSLLLLSSHHKAAVGYVEGVQCGLSATAKNAGVWSAGARQSHEVRP